MVELAPCQITFEGGGDPWGAGLEHLTGLTDAPQGRHQVERAL